MGSGVGWAAPRKGQWMLGGQRPQALRVQPPVPQAVTPCSSSLDAAPPHTKMFLASLWQAAVTQVSLQALQWQLRLMLLVPTLTCHSAVPELS